MNFKQKLKNKSLFPGYIFKIYGVQLDKPKLEVVQSQNKRKSKTMLSVLLITKFTIKLLLKYSLPHYRSEGPSVTDWPAIISLFLNKIVSYRT